MSLTKKRVAVLRGGHRHHYDDSLKTGAFVLKNLPENFEAFDCLIDKEGVWHFGGLPRKPEKIFSQVDVVFNALHGRYGEDGQIQNLFKTHNIKHTGAGVMSSVFSMNKKFSKNIWSQLGIKLPPTVILNKGEINKKKIYDLWTSFPQPSVVKPVSSGHSVGVSFVKSLEDLEMALDLAFSVSSEVIMEEYIKGREVIAGLIKDFRGQKFYSLPVFEVKKDSPIFHRDHKVNSTVTFDHLSLTPVEKIEATKIAEIAFRSLGESSYATVDMIIHPKRGVYLLELNTNPALNDNSPLISSLDLVGVKPSYFLEHIINL